MLGSNNIKYSATVDVVHSRLNAVAKWIAFPLCIWEVSGSNLDLGISYPDISRDFPPSLQANASIVP
jgi:hypothetical protein